MAANAQLRRTRGAALAELAVVTPVLLVMLLASMYLAELVRVRIKLEEPARFAAWETTSYTLSDFSSQKAGRHPHASKLARAGAESATVPRYADLDSAEAVSPGNYFVRLEGFSVQVDDSAASATASSVQAPTDGDDSLWNAQVRRALAGKLGATYDRLGFNNQGLMQARAQISVKNLIWPQRFLGEEAWGGVNLATLSLEARHAVIADAWRLVDGADAQMARRGLPGGAKSGVHRDGSVHLLRKQVRRLTFAGLDKSVSSLPAYGFMKNTLGRALPNPFGTFVVSHNYGLAPQNVALRGCTHDPGHPAQDGLNNLEKFASLDYERRNCYDTTPFREVSGYVDPAHHSPYVEMFSARGAHFMGCKRPMADDPTQAGVPSTSTGDANTKKVPCESL